MVFTLTTGCGDDDGTTPDPDPDPTADTIADIVRADARFTTLATALDTAGLLDAVDGPGPLTVMAPTDDAFDAFAQALDVSLDDVLALDELGDVLRYHVVAGQFGTAELEQVAAITTLEGTAIRVLLDSGGIALNDEVRIVGEQIAADNGVIHVLDAVLTRPLITTTKQYTSRPDVVLADGDDSGVPGRHSDSIVISDDTGFVRELAVQLDIRHPLVAQLSVTLEHAETGTVLQLVSGLGTRLDDINANLTDGAMLDVLDDAVFGFDAAQAFPEDDYRPFEPLEFAFGEPLEGEWTLHVDDRRAGEVGRLVAWGMTATFSEARPAPTIAFARPREFTGVLPQGFTEVTNIRIKRLAGLEGPVELTVEGAAGVAVEPIVLEDGQTSAPLSLIVDGAAEVGPRNLGIVATSGNTTRILAIDAEVVAPDAQGVELLAHVPLPALDAPGGAGNDIWGWTDPMTNKEYALMGTTMGTAFVDITAPQNPVMLGSLPTHTFPSQWRDIKVYDDHAFIVSEATNHGMQVFDLTQLRAVTEPQVFSATAHNGDFGNAHNIAINEDTGFAYIVGATEAGFDNVCFGGLLMIDITTPTSPTFAGCFSGAVPPGQEPGPAFPTDAYIHDAQCVTYAGPDLDYQGRELCVTSDGQVQSFDNYLGLADVTNKADVIQVARITYEGAGYAHQGWLTEDHQYFILNDEFDEFIVGANTRSYVFDVRDLDRPVLLGIFDNPRDAVGHNTYIAGDLAYQANYTSGLRIVDVENIGTMDLTEVGYFDTYPDDDADDDGISTLSRRIARCSAEPLPGATLWHPGETGSGCGVAAFQGAWSNYPFFASGVVVISDIDRGLFIVQPDGNL